MQQVNTTTAFKACMRNNRTALENIVPGYVVPNSRAQEVRIHDRPCQIVPLLCICAAYGSLECFEYLVENGAISYYADVVSFAFIIMRLRSISPADTGTRTLSSGC
jgi:hypothetical protein